MFIWEVKRLHEIYGSYTIPRRIVSHN
jgi:hypothetical protein